MAASRLQSGLQGNRLNNETRAYTSRMISTQFLRSIALKRDSIADFNDYPFNLPAITHLQQLEFHPKVTFIVGENGSGKSTLLEAIAVALGFNAEGGTKNFNFNTRESHSDLHQHLKLSKGIKEPKNGFFLRAESFFNVASHIENLDKEPAFGPPIITYYGGKSLHEQSHGESFLALMTHRFGSNGLYILDEPEAALSPQRQLAALARIHDLVTEQSQFIIATHSPILMAYPDAWIYQCGQNGIEKVPYQETEHYQITRDFLNNPQRMLKQLLQEE